MFSLVFFEPDSLLGWLGPAFGALGLFALARAYARQKTGEVWESTAKGWQANYEGEKERGDRLEQRLNEERDMRAAEERQQTELRHELKGQLAAERMKTDLTALMKAMQAQHIAVLEKLGEAQMTGVAAIREAVGGTEERILAQLATISKSQAGQAKILERVAARLEHHEEAR